MKSVLLAGCNGGFGRVFAEKLSAAGFSVHGVDLHPEPAPGLSLASYVSAPIADLEPSVHSFVESVDLVLLCVPTEAVLKALPTLVGKLREGGAVVDISSVKTHIAAEVQRLDLVIGYLSIHPMFPPVSDFEGRAIVFSPLSSNATVMEFIALLSSWKAVLTEMNPVEHDTATSFVQTLPHAALLSFGLAIADASVNFEKLWRISTPIQRILLGALLRVVGNDKLVHFDIQSENPFAGAARFALVAATKKLEAAMQTGSPLEFLNLLTRIENMLETNRSALSEIAASIVSKQSTAPQFAHGDDTRELGIE
jgi:prephenate dehydrogenase